MKNKLISMVDFVKEQYNIGIEARSIPYQHLNRASRFEKIVKYAKFLEQPLELWMFVPCKLVGGVWVVLEKPCGYNNFLEYGANDFLNIEECKEYQEAKDRVLFDGFKTREQGHEILVTTLDNENVWINWNDSKTIENLIYLKPTLTRSAKTLLGL